MVRYMALTVCRYYDYYTRHWKGVLGLLLLAGVILLLAGVILYYESTRQHCTAMGYDVRGHSMETKPSVTKHVKETDYTRTRRPDTGSDVISWNRENEPQGGHGKTMILIISYMRTGSTLLGEIIQQVPNVFFNFEPVKHYLLHNWYMTRDRGVCSSIMNRCRYDGWSRETYRRILNGFMKFYGCDFHRLSPEFVWGHHKSSSIMDLKSCIAYFEPEICISTGIEMCKSSIMTIKTIRLSMDVAEHLMGSIPQLKVIHLLRDPRGIINSRMHVHNVKKSMDLSIVARLMCARLLRDVHRGEDMKQRYRNRIKTVLYEEIAENPAESSRRLFDFLNVQPSSSFNEWLTNHTSAGHASNKYHTIRANSTETASAWREQMRFSDVGRIDKECSKLYKYTGHLPVPDKDSFRDVLTSLRTHSDIYN